MKDTAQAKLLAELNAIQENYTPAQAKAMLATEAFRVHVSTPQKRLPAPKQLPPGITRITGSLNGPITPEGLKRLKAALTQLQNKIDPNSGEE